LKDYLNKRELGDKKRMFLIKMNKFGSVICKIIFKKILRMKMENPK